MQELHSVRSPKERKKGIGEIFEKVMAECFTNLGKIINLQVQEAPKTPNQKHGEN